MTPLVFVENCTLSDREHIFFYNFFTIAHIHCYFLNVYIKLISSMGNRLHQKSEYFFDIRFFFY